MSMPKKDEDEATSARRNGHGMNGSEGEIDDNGKTIGKGGAPSPGQRSHSLRASQIRHEDGVPFGGAPPPQLAQHHVPSMAYYPQQFSPHPNYPNYPADHRNAMYYNDHRNAFYDYHHQRHIPPPPPPPPPPSNLEAQNHYMGMMPPPRRGAPYSEVFPPHPMYYRGHPPPHYMSGHIHGPYPYRSSGRRPNGGRSFYARFVVFCVFLYFATFCAVFYFGRDRWSSQHNPLSDTLGSSYTKNLLEGLKESALDGFKKSALADPSSFIQENRIPDSSSETSPDSSEATSQDESDNEEATEEATEEVPAADADVSEGTEENVSAADFEGEKLEVVEHAEGRPVTNAVANDDDDDISLGDNGGEDGNDPSDSSPDDAPGKVADEAFNDDNLSDEEVLRGIIGSPENGGAAQEATENTSEELDTAPQTPDAALEVPDPGPDTPESQLEVPDPGPETPESPLEVPGDAAENTSPEEADPVEEAPATASEEGKNPSENPDNSSDQSGSAPEEPSDQSVSAPEEPQGEGSAPGDNAHREEEDDDDMAGEEEDSPEKSVQKKRTVLRPNINKNIDREVALKQLKLEREAKFGPNASDKPDDDDDVAMGDEKISSPGENENVDAVVDSVLAKVVPTNPSEAEEDASRKVANDALEKYRERKGKRTLEDDDDATTPDEASQPSKELLDVQPKREESSPKDVEKSPSDKLPSSESANQFDDDDDYYYDPETNSVISKKDKTKASIKEGTEEDDDDNTPEEDDDDGIIYDPKSIYVVGTRNITTTNANATKDDDDDKLVDAPPTTAAGKTGNSEASPKSKSTKNKQDKKSNNDQKGAVEKGSKSVSKKKDSNAGKKDKKTSAATPEKSSDKSSGTKKNVKVLTTRIRNKSKQNATELSESPSSGERAGDSSAGRRERIKGAVKHAWNGYRSFSFGYDELKPVSQKSEDRWGGLATTLLDSLDTLWMTGMEEEFKEARDWVGNNLKFNSTGRVSVFETTIRNLGGLLSAYDLSGDELFLQKAEELGKLLSKSFEGTNGLPFGRVYLNGAKPPENGASLGGDVALAEVATLQVEFRYLSSITGKKKYSTLSEAVFAKLLEISPEDGLFPVYLRNDGVTAEFTRQIVSFGAMGDSAYEYMLKMWLQGGRSESVYRDMYDKAIQGMHDRLLQKDPVSGLTYIAKLTDGNLEHEMEHLACFSGALLALGAYTDPLGLDSERAQRDLATAKDLAYTCYQMYTQMPTGLSPESVLFTNEGLVAGHEKKYALRPELVESLYILHKLTNEAVYQEWGWEIFEAIERYCKTSIAYATYSDVTSANSLVEDSMESFFIAETLKYLYLLFDSESEIDLVDKVVFNTEAHPLRILPLVKRKK